MRVVVGLEVFAAIDRIEACRCGDIALAQQGTPRCFASLGRGTLEIVREGAGAGRELFLAIQRFGRSGAGRQRADQQSCGTRESGKGEAEFHVHGVILRGSAIQMKRVMNGVIGRQLSGLNRYRVHARIYRPIRRIKRRLGLTLHLLGRCGSRVAWRVVRAARASLVTSAVHRPAELYYPKGIRAQNAVRLSRSTVLWGYKFLQLRPRGIQVGCTTADNAELYEMHALLHYPRCAFSAWLPGAQL